MFFHVILLVILYLFIFRIVLLIIKDLHRERADAFEPGQPPAAERGQVSRQSRLTPVLRIVESDEPQHPPGEQIDFDRVIYIGRGESNQINLSASFASQRHARIIFREGSYFLEDLGSTNGTYIHGVRITEPALLQDGDLIKVAAVTLRFVRWENEME